MNPNDIRKQAQAKAEQAKAIRANAATRDLTEDEERQATDLVAEAGKLEKRAKDLDAAAELESRYRTPEGRDSDPLPFERETRHSYSFLRACARFLENHGRVDGLEGETSAELEKRYGRAPKGFLVPLGLASRPDFDGPEGRRRLLAAVERRALDTTAAAGAIFELPFGSIIEALRAKTIAGRVGATVLGDLQGKFALPKQTAASTFGWVAEGVGGSASNVEIGQVEMSPATLTGYTEITRAAMKQTSYDVESFARSDLNKGLSVALDKAGLQGSGSGAEPTGLINNSDITTVALDTNGDYLSWDDLVDMETAVAEANADDGPMAYVTTPKVRGKMKKTFPASNTFGVSLWGFQGAGGQGVSDNVNGYPGYATKQLPDNLTKGSSSGILSAMLFGMWSDLLYALWGGVDVLPDPYAKATSGGIRVHLYQDADIVVRRTESFVRCLDIKTA